MSRRPPHFIYTTDQDTLPEQLFDFFSLKYLISRTFFRESDLPSRRVDEEQAGQVTDDEAANGSEQSPPVTTTPSAQFPAVTVTEEHIPTTASTPPLLAILQKAELVADSQRSIEQVQRVQATRTALNSGRERRPVKQILFLDDYEQVQGDEEVELEGVSTTMAADQQRIAGTTKETSNLGEEDRAGEGQGSDQEEPFRERGLSEGSDEPDREEQLLEENEDEDLFFFKPRGDRSGRGAPIDQLIVFSFQALNSSKRA